MRSKNRKHRLASAVLAVVLVLGCCGGVLAGDSIVPDMNFVGEPIQMSLEEAVKIMQTTGSTAETALLNKKSDQAVAQGYSESSRTLSDTIDSLNAIMGVPGTTSVIASAQASGATTTNLKILEMQRDFAKSMIDTNFEAEMNQIESQTVQIFYGLLQARENLNVTKDNLKVQKDLLANVQKKYNLGLAAKIDVTVAESAVLNAETNVAAAETAYKTAKMNFNYLLGYDVMQEVEVTDELEALPLPEVTLVEAIQSALEKRPELKGTAFALQVQDILLKSVEVKYPKDSATYLQQLVAYEQSAKMAEDLPSYIEIDIRTKYMQMMDLHAKIKTAEATQANAQAAYDIALISYNSGLNTLADVQQAQVQSFQAGQAVTAAITAYNLAVYDFEHSMGVGTSRISF
ncbi:MAG: TolC family protein [Firmicutes bacterium]|nr:TolC family protein [Bacillota bacterium]